AGAETILVQRWVAGDAASVSLLVAGRGAVALSLNSQELRIGIPCDYEGGAAAIDHARRDEAFDLAARAVGLVPGLRGYVGVDLVLAPEGCFLVEINPRLTTSYVGLRRALAFNLAEAHWKACICDTLPTTVRFRALRGHRAGQALHRDAGGEAVPAHA
ncbi:MAG: ATP-grasp domain-containing protein, partial [Actinomycetota bacterium]